MCITFFCLQPATSSKIKLILGFNRQQQTTRKTLPLHQYEEDKNIYAGRDLISGGTWLGVNIETGILAILTNYDLEIYRYGLSRGQLVFSFLKSSFVPQNKRKDTDQIIQHQLKRVARKSQEYSPFNLTIINLRTRKAFYVCSERQQQTNAPVQLAIGKTHGICNSDIETVWPKTALGLSLFNSLKEKLGQMNEGEMLQEMKKIFKNKQRFSEVDDDQSSIFVQPYFCKAQGTERRTKTTLMLLLKEQGGQKELILNQTTYQAENMKQAQILLRLPLQD